MRTIDIYINVRLLILVFVCESHPTAIGICPVVVKPTDDVKRGRLRVQALKPERCEVIWLRKDTKYVINI